MNKQITRLFSFVLALVLVLALLPQPASAAARSSRDRVAPTAPGSLRATAVSNTSVTLAWQAASDRVGVTRYEVTCNGRRAAVTAGLSATVGGLRPNRKYTFSVRAFDAAGNRSRASRSVAVKTRLLPPPVTAPQPTAAPQPTVAPQPTASPQPTAAAEPTAAPQSTAAAEPTGDAQSGLAASIPEATLSPDVLTAVTQPVSVLVPLPATETVVEFPVRSYGVLPRDEYGAQSSVVTSADSLSQVDTGSAARGIVLVRVNAPEDGRRWKAIVRGPGGSYALDLNRRQIDLGLPLTLGSGSYSVAIYEQVSGSTYTPHQTVTFSAALASELSPFTAATLMTDFSSTSECTLLAARLVAGKSSQVERIDAIYQWVAANISYDRDLAASIVSGSVSSYVPNPDATLASRKGICFDYAALMAAMLRSQGIPARLVIGQTSIGYHAWNEAYIEGTGWVSLGGTAMQTVSGSSWLTLDATLAASGLPLQTSLGITRTRERIY